MLIIALIILILLGYKLSIDFKNNKFEITRIEQARHEIQEPRKEEIPKTTEENKVEQNTIDNNEIGTTKQDYDNGKKVLVNVFSVVDGDTIKVTLNNEKYTVRLVGVDTPESVHPNKEKNTKEGKIASDYTKSRLQDKNVYVQKDVSGTDRYR